MHFTYQILSAVIDSFRVPWNISDIRNNVTDILNGIQFPNEDAATEIDNEIADMLNAIEFPTTFQEEVDEFETDEFGRLNPKVLASLAG